MYFVWFIYVYTISICFHVQIQSLGRYYWVFLEHNSTTGHLFKLILLGSLIWNLPYLFFQNLTDTQTTKCKSKLKLPSKALGQILFYLILHSTEIDEKYLEYYLLNDCVNNNNLLRSFYSCAIPNCGLCQGYTIPRRLKVIDNKK